MKKLIYFLPVAGSSSRLSSSCCCCCSRRCGVLRCSGPVKPGQRRNVTQWGGENADRDLIIHPWVWAPGCCCNNKARLSLRPYDGPAGCRLHLQAGPAHYSPDPQTFTDLGHVQPHKADSETLKRWVKMMLSNSKVNLIIQHVCNIISVSLTPVLWNRGHECKYV